jgi:hypothetical protein
MTLSGVKHARNGSVRRHSPLGLALIFGVLGLQAATLERLSFEEMTARSTSIVRGKVESSWAAFSGPTIYTHFRVRVTERFKGPSETAVEIVVAGGVVNNLRQSFSGVPELTAGEEYVFFLWTGKNRLTQVIGLTQGVFSLAKDSAADPTATRRGSRELMFERSTGKPVQDQTLVMRMSELRTRIHSTLGAKGK